MSAVSPLNPRLEALRTGFLARDHQLFVDGRWAAAQSGQSFDVLDPATGARLARAAAGEAADIDRAVKAARKAFQSGPWPRLTHAERAKLIFKLADAVERNADELALIETLDGGNPLRSTRNVDVAMAIESLRYNAGWATKLTGETALSQAPSRSFTFTLREPIGVVGAITPWNAPFLMAVNKIGPALAAGCTVVLKPAELAPLSALRLAQLIEEIELPRGVVNVVTGYGQTAGQALVDHPDVNKISFTGSTRVGKSIVTGSAAHMKRVTLELGGKSPVVVFPDADIEAATEASSRATALGAPVIELDFGAVDYINSTGITLIVRLLAEARRDHREVRARGPDGALPGDLPDHPSVRFRDARGRRRRLVDRTPCRSAPAPRKKPRAMADPGTRVEVHSTDDQAASVVAIFGDVTGGSEPALMEAFVKAVDRGARTIVLDFAGSST